MDDARYDVVGIGNAIVDIIGRCDDAFLSKHDLAQGPHALDRCRAGRRALRGHGPRHRALGRLGGQHRSRALPRFGGSAAFIGRVADDQFGKVFAHDIRAIGVTYDTPPAKSGAPTALCLILVTPDGERTMNTFLGASTELGTGEVDAEPDHVGARHLSGRLPVRQARGQAGVPHGGQRSPPRPAARRR